MPMLMLFQRRCLRQDANAEISKGPFLIIISHPYSDRDYTLYS